MLVTDPRHLSLAALENGLEQVLRSPTDGGTLDLLVRRPGPGEREVLDEGELDLEVGLVGDSWHWRGSRRTPDGSPHPEMQLNVMNSRVAALVAGTPDRRALAGDQLFLDLDLGHDNLPAGSRLAVGGAVIEVMPLPHTGCPKFVAHFGSDAMRFVNGGVGRPLRLRGLCARVVAAGTVRPGDTVVKL